MNSIFKFPALLLFLSFASCNSGTKTTGEPGSVLSNRETGKMGDTAKITVAAAANLRFVMADIERAFEQSNNMKIDVVIASSGKLYSQIVNGAPYDVFMSANMKYPDRLYKEGLTAVSPRIYALGVLVMWSKKDLDLSEGLRRLDRDDIEKIAVAMDRNAPYGTAAREALTAVGLFEKLEPKLVFGESVSQVNQYVVSKSVDVGLSNKSVICAMGSDSCVWHDIDRSLYSPIKQGVVITNYGAANHPEACGTFIDFLIAPETREIFTKHGYLSI